MKFSIYLNKRVFVMWKSVGCIFIRDGRMRTLSKYSAHLFKIASLSVRSVLPSELRCGVAPELSVP